jgi:hypothetical protein
VLYLNQYTCVKLGLAVTVQTSWTEDHVVTVYVGCETDTTGTGLLNVEWMWLDFWMLNECDLTFECWMNVTWLLNVWYVIVNG